MTIVGRLPAESLGHGDHVLAAFDCEADQHEALAMLVDGGLAAGEQVWYLADRRPVSSVVDFLRRGGVSVTEPLEAGQLVVRSADETFLAELPFEPARMIRWLDSAVDNALAHGYAGLRLAGEMTWAIRHAPGPALLLEYERRIQELLAGRPAVAICQYDLRHFAPDDADAAATYHSHTLQFESRSGLRIEMLPEHPGLRIDGEIDLFNRDELRSALAQLPQSVREIHLFLTDLRFIDVAGVGELSRFGRERPRCLVLHDPPRLLRHMLDLFWPDVEVRITP